MTQSGPELCANLLDTLYAEACQPTFSEEMNRARELFAIATGQINDDDPFFELRMQLFTEYFLFDYRLEKIFPGVTLFEHYLYRLGAAASAESSAESDPQARWASLLSFESLRSMRHSLFEVKNHTSRCIKAQDIFSGQVVELHAIPDVAVLGIEPGQIFEGRIFWIKDTFVLSSACLFHPIEVAPLIKKQLRSFLGVLREQGPRTFLSWKQELQRRQEILRTVASQKKQLEGAEKKRAIDLLNVSRSLAPITHVIESADLQFVFENPGSPYFGAQPLYGIKPFIHTLSYCELRRHRYKHIHALRIYNFDKLESIRAHDLRSQEYALQNS